MRLKTVLPVVVAIVLTVVAACGETQSQTDQRRKQSAAIASQNARMTQIAKAIRDALATQYAKDHANDNANANGNDSANVQKPVVAGALLPNTARFDTNPALVMDGQGKLSAFFQTAAPSQGYTVAHTQLQADGAWTKPEPAAAEFQFLYNLTVLPDPAGRPCLLISGEMFDPHGNAVDGLFRNCQTANGAWPAQAELAAGTAASAVFSPARAPDGSLQLVFVTQGRLYFGAVGSHASTALTGTQLSGSQQVQLGQLAIDSHGGYHAAWTETDGSQAFTVQYRFSKDGGHTWTPAEQLDSGTADNPGRIGFQLVAGSAGQVHLAWDADRAIHYRGRGVQNGWGAPVTLSSDALNSGVVLAVAKDGSARAAWQISAADSSVVMRVQSADGAWGPPVTVTPTQAFALALAVDAGGVSHVLWQAGDGLRYLALP